MNDNLWGFRVIDGMGNVHEFSRDDEDPDLFWAMSPNMGLLGVVSTITLQCVDDYNVSGQEAISSVEDCAVDLIGPGDDKRPSLEQCSAPSQQGLGVRIEIEHLDRDAASSEGRGKRAGHGPVPEDEEPRRPPGPDVEPTPVRRGRSVRGQP